MYDEKGIQIKDYDGMKEYFNYEHVRQIILEDKEEQYGSRVGSVVKGSNQRGAEIVLRVIEYAPENLFDGEDEKLFLEMPNTDERRINWEGLRGFLQEFEYEHEDELIQIAEDATGRGISPLDGKKAYELLLFCVLFAYMQREPGDSDVVLFRKYLDLNLVQVALQGEKKPIQITESPTELPCYQHCAGTMPKLDWVVLHNAMEETALVTLSGCPLRRHLAPGEELLALTAGGNVAAFLPRLCTIQNLVVYQDDDALMIDQRRMPLEQNGAPVAFTESKKYGYLIADRDGKLLSERREGDPEHIRWLKGDVQDYGFLTLYGAYRGSLAMQGWNRLLLFDLSGENSVALTADRKAINSRGQVLGKEIAAVSCCGKSYALLRMDGTVVIGQMGADQREASVSSAHAVCADANGFWIASDESLIRLRKDGIVSAEYPYVMDEIERDNTGMTVYGLCADGSVQRLPQR